MFIKLKQLARGFVTVCIFFSSFENLMQSYGTLFMTGSITSRPVNVNCTETSVT